MASHSGVSCDACMISNFPGRRYKCLLCDNYDLCGNCYDSQSESQNHKSAHPMQCMLTEAFAEVFYRGELNSRRATVSLTCPYCAQSGFIPRTLLAHCADKHSQPSKAPQVVMCPICITSSQRSRSRFVLLADHIAAEHDDGGSIFEDDTAANIIRQTRRTQQHEKFSDDEVEDEPEDNWFNDPDTQNTPDPDQRRNDVNHLRALNLFRNIATGTNENTWLANIGNTVNVASRRPYSRPTTSRVSRGTYRGVGHYHSRGFSFFSQANSSSGAHHSNSSDAQGNNGSQTTTPVDTSTSLFSQDPFAEFIHNIMNEQRGSTNNPASIPPINPNSTETNRLQQQESQQNDGQDPTKQNKATSQNKQKRSSQSRIKLFGGTPPPLTNALNQQLHEANLCSDTPLGSAPGNPLSLRASNSVQQENEPRSLIARMLKEDSNVNRNEMNETRRRQIQTHTSFVHSVILSTMLNSPTESWQTNEQNQREEPTEENL